MSRSPAPWGSAIVGLSLLFVAVTPLPYGIGERGVLTEVLFWLGLGGDRNAGAWWSGILFLLAAVFASDRMAEACRTDPKRRGWGALAGALTLLSFDEIAQLHEFLSTRDWLYLVPLGFAGFSLVAYSLIQLRRSHVPLRKLLIAFGLLATVPLQEWLQHALEWSNPWIYGVRALVEEGTEVVAALTLVAATSGGLLRLRAGKETFASVVWLGTPLWWLAVCGFPLAAVAAYRLNFAGAANWLGTGLFLACALLSIRSAASRGPAQLLAPAFYLLASFGSNAVRPDWDPAVFGQSVNLRGLFFGSLLLAAPWVLSAGEPWHRRAVWLALAGCTLLAGFVLLRPQVIWSTWPPTLALLCFYVEISAAVRMRPAIVLGGPTAVPGAETHKTPTLAGPL